MSFFFISIVQALLSLILVGEMSTNMIYYRFRIRTTPIYGLKKVKANKK